MLRSFSLQRSNYPRVNLFSSFVVISWSTAINIFFDYLLSENFSFIEVFTGPFLDLEGAFAVKSFFNSFGCSNINYQFNNSFFSDHRFNFLLSSTLLHLDRLFLCVFLGLNLRVECPLLNSRLRKNFLRNGSSFLCLYFGLSLDYLSFPVFSLGNSLRSFRAFIEGRSFLFSSFVFDFNSVFFKTLNLNFSIYKSCSFFIGSSILNRPDCNFFFDSIALFASKNFRLFNFKLDIVSNYLGRISSFEVGSLPGVNSSNFVFNRRSGCASFLYFLGTDEYFNTFDDYNLGNFFVYQGSFFNYNFFFQSMHLIFPVSIYTERVSSFLNVEGRLRKTCKTVIPFRFVYTDLEIFKALFCFKNMFFLSNFSVVSNFKYTSSLFFTFIDYSCVFFFNIMENTFKYIYKENLLVPLYVGDLVGHRKVVKIYNTVISRDFSHYYNSDIFSRNSKILSICFMRAGLSNFTRSFI